MRAAGGGLCVREGNQGGAWGTCARAAGACRAMCPDCRKDAQTLPCAGGEAGRAGRHVLTEACAGWPCGDGWGAAAEGAWRALAMSSGTPQEGSACGCHGRRGKRCGATASRSDTERSSGSPRFPCRPLLVGMATKTSPLLEPPDGRCGPTTTGSPPWAATQRVETTVPTAHRRPRRGYCPND